jgi:hypothetical protein
MLRMFCARDEWEKVSVGTNLGFWCDACARAEGAGAYLVRLQHVGNLSTHLLLHLLHPSGVRALHTQRGDRGTRRARVRNGVRFFVPRAEGRREGGAHGGDAQGGTAVQRRAGASARCLRGGTHTRYARGGANRRHHAHDRRHRVTCPRVPTKVRCRRLQLETDHVARSENFRASSATWSTRGQLLSRNARCRQPRPPLRGARAWGRRRVLPARTVALSRRAPSSGVSGPSCAPHEESRLRHFRRSNVWS